MVIGIITDFGNNFYVGIMKGVIKKINDNASIIDIDNNIPKFSILSGSYVMYTSYRYLPKNSILLSVVDPGVGTQRKALIVRTRNYYFIGPDNGLLYQSIIDDGVIGVYEILIKNLLNYLESKFSIKLDLSHTFHGRDVFAPSAALISLNEDIENYSKPITVDEITKLSLFNKVIDNGITKLYSIYIDDFGNIVLSSRFNDLNMLNKKELTLISNNKEFKLYVGKKFADVKEGELLLYENSFGFAEIAINKGNASKEIDAKVGDLISIY